MFPEGARFIQDINKVIKIFPEEASNKVLRSAKNKPKKDNDVAGIDRLVIPFCGKIYKSGKQFLMR